MTNSFVFRDPAEREVECWRVYHRGRIMPPTFNSRGAALAYGCRLRRDDKEPVR